jgi:serine/threonine protein kinase
VGASRNPPVFCIITEYLAGGSLRSFLHKQNHASLPLPELILIALGVARGMEYIHSQRVVHRDLKPENILLDCGADPAGMNVKIADFGISCEEKLCEEVGEDSGTYRWMAPEMVRHQPYCRKVDVYSFGLLLWEMVSGRMPFEEMTPIQAAFAVVDKVHGKFDYSIMHTQSSFLCFYLFHVSPSYFKILGWGLADGKRNWSCGKKILWLPVS